MTSLWRLRLGILGLVGIVMLAAACGAPQQPTTPQQPAEQGEEGKKRGGVLRIVDETPGGPIGVPWETISSGVIPAIPVLEGFFWVDWQNKIHPRLAERWEADPDNKTVTVYLRRGVKFHDGTDFNAEAVRYNLEKQVEAGRLTVVDSVEVLGEHSVRVHLKQWQITAISNLNVNMISPSAVEKNGLEWARYHPVGTGPFEFVDFQRDTSAEFKRFDAYWDEGKPYLDGIEMRFIRDPQTLKAAFLSGVIDAFGTGDRQLVAELLAAGYPHAKGRSGTSVNVLIPDSANEDSPLADRRVRQAISHAIDRQALAEAQGSGIDQPVYQLAAPGWSAYFDDYEGHRYDPDRAKKLLAEAGYPNGFTTTLIPAPHVERDVAVAIQSFLSKVGIRAEIETPESTRFIEYRTKGWDGMLIDRLGFLPLYASFATHYFGKESTSVFASLRRPDGLQQKIEEARTVPTDEMAVSLGRELHRMLLDDITHIPLTTGSRYYFFQSYVRDTHHLEWSAWPTWTPGEAWLDK